MKSVSLSGSLRENVGKKDAAELRKSGRVPSVLYGGENQVHFHVSELELGKLIYSPDTFQIELDLDGTKYRCVIQETQYHPVTDRPVHLDLLQLFDDKEVTVELRVRTQGTALGILNGGRLSMVYRRIPVKGLPNALPDYIDLDITDLDIGDSLRVSDVPHKGFAIVKPDSDVIVGIRRTRAAMSVAAEEVEGEEGEEGEEGAEGAAEGAAEGSEASDKGGE